MTPPKPQILYRLYNAADRLLYIGITTNTTARFAEHRAHQPWWPEVARSTEERYYSRSQVETAELAAIASEEPLYNKVGRPVYGPTAYGRFRKVKTTQACPRFMVRLEGDEIRRFHAAATAHGITVGELARQMILDYLAQQQEDTPQP